jgi:hypothetical protein
VNGNNITGLYGGGGGDGGRGLAGRGRNHLDNNLGGGYYGNNPIYNRGGLGGGDATGYGNIRNRKQHRNRLADYDYNIINT